MTHGFDRLLYTDCKAGMGREAGGGFQVQAQSVGVDAAQAKMARSWLLYEAQEDWIVQHRAVEDFPLGFAHASEAGFGTAQSCYIGTEATGARQGNHLADCLLIHDPDLYGPVRPVQLWRSQLWRSEPWSSKDCPQFTEPLPVGPLTVDAISRWLQDDKDRKHVLIRLLSLLEDPAGHRIVITARKPDDALMWIAAATLLLPIRAALDVSFKVFCANAQQASQRIVAVPADLNSQVAPGRGGSRFVIDTERCSSDEAPVSLRAEFWVRLLATWDDPYDVVDAVELAESLDPGMCRGGIDAMITAWATTAPSEPPSDPPALFRWLTGTTAELMQEYGPAVISQILTASPPPNVLRWLDAAAGNGRVEVDDAALRGLLLTAEIGEIHAGHTPPSDALAIVAADHATTRDAESELSSAILLGSDDEVDKLLRLAGRHGVVLQLPPLLERLTAFVAEWLSQPAAGFDPDQWVLRAEIMDLAYDELRARLQANGIQAVSDALGRLWCNFVDRDTDLSDPLACQVQVLALSTLTQEAQLAKLTHLLDSAQRSADPGLALAAIQDALVRWRILGRPEAWLVASVLPFPIRLDPDVVRLTVAELKLTLGRTTPQTLQVLRNLDKRGVAPADYPFPELITSDKDIERFTAIIRKHGFNPHSTNIRRYLRRLNSAEPEVLRARMGLLLRTCVECDTPEAGAELLCVLPDVAVPWLVNEWARGLHGEQGLRYAAWGVSWYADARIDETPRWYIGQSIIAFRTSLPPDLQESWTLGVLEQLDEELGNIFSALFDEQTKKRRLFGRSQDKEG